MIQVVLQRFEINVTIVHVKNKDNKSLMPFHNLQLLYIGIK